MTHARATAIAKLLAEKDFKDLLYLKFGSEGYNGEDLIEVLQQISDKELELTRNRQNETDSDSD